MFDSIDQWFAAVCGQDPSHTWATGGVLLPLCQRCTGLYVGAAIAASLHVFLRPELTGRLLKTQGAFLLVMVPFGFHWIPQGAFLRTITGVLFGFGVVTFLWLPIKTAVDSLKTAFERRDGNSRGLAYAAGVVATAILLPVLCAYGGKLIAYAVSALAAAGAIAVGVLATGNVFLALKGAWRMAGRVVS